MASCNLCIDLKNDESNSEWNRPLLEYENFLVIPSIGALVEGWLLLVPKGHFLSMATLPDDQFDQLLEIKKEISALLRRLYGPLVVFEHGPSKENSSVGCGVDHAHLHFVPHSSELLTEILPLLPETVSHGQGDLISCREAVLEGTDYLYLEQQDDCFVFFNNGFEGQLIRRALANKLKLSEQYNWRKHPRLDVVRATISRVGYEVGGCVCDKGIY